MRGTIGGVFMGGMVRFVSLLACFVFACSSNGTDSNNTSAEIVEDCTPMHTFCAKQLVFLCEQDLSWTYVKTCENGLVCASGDCEPPGTNPESTPYVPPTCEVAEEGACLSESDRDAFCNGEAWAKTESCSLSCAEGPHALINQCMLDCFMETFSENCTTACMEAFYRCPGEECKAACSDPHSDPCSDCIDNTCTVNLETCAGVSALDPYQSEDKSIGPEHGP